MFLQVSTLVAVWAWLSRLARESHCEERDGLASNPPSGQPQNQPPKLHQQQTGLNLPERRRF